ncbi:MAG: molybdenum cofactor biosynthesis protein MoaE [Actinomycetota bacterium]|nr:MAG: molybdenum cofactor biosynthesis protein MoaE [Actinomycetota bacterium]
MGEVRLVAIRDTPLQVDEVLAAVADSRAGGVAVFVGTVRDHDEGIGVAALDYRAHPSAADVLGAVAAEVADEPEVVAVAAVHRTGDLAIGDAAVVVAVACAHRGDAFAACRRLIDELKNRVPIWKNQHHTDGSSHWVGSP